MTTTASEARAARTVYAGQFRLTRLQVKDWGTFCGYKDLPVDERGVMFTGPSGSGKSTLMDAHSEVLLPHNVKSFNASADLVARGAKQGSRNTAAYVRGAWSEGDDDHGHGQVRYLRGGKPTWSAIAATYDDGLGQVTTAVVVRWFTGTEIDSAALKTMRQLHDGQFDLRGMEPWAASGFKLDVFKRQFPAAALPKPEQYTAALCKRIGIGSSKAALTLLGRAKAMKNVGDLNYFIRDNMLDEPASFEAVQALLATFTPLNEAYQVAWRSWRQEKVLRAVPGYWQTWQDADVEARMVAELAEDAAEQYLRFVHLAVLADELDTLEAALQVLAGTLKAQESEAEDARIRHQGLAKQLRTEGETLTGLTEDLGVAERELAARTAAHARLAALLVPLNLEAPADAAGFAALHAGLPTLADDAEQTRAWLRPKHHKAVFAAGKLSEEHGRADAELQALLTSPSLIGGAALARRHAIAAGAKVPVDQLPYAAELIDVAAENERWRPAAEKVLRSFGMRLLVPERHQQAVREFIDAHDMRGLGPV